MEGLLGRPAFHRVFDHMRTLASAADPEGMAGLSVSAYFTRQLGDSEVVAQLIQVGIRGCSTPLIEVGIGGCSTQLIQLGPAGCSFQLIQVGTSGYSVQGCGG